MTKNSIVDFALVEWKFVWFSHAMQTISINFSHRISPVYQISFSLYTCSTCVQWLVNLRVGWPQKMMTSFWILWLWLRAIVLRCSSFMFHVFLFGHFFLIAITLVHSHWGFAKQMKSKYIYDRDSYELQPVTILFYHTCLPPTHQSYRNNSLKKAIKTIFRICLAEHFEYLR